LTFSGSTLFWAFRILAYQTLDMENNDAQAFLDDSGVRIDRGARLGPGEKEREELRIEGREDV